MERSANTIDVLERAQDRLHGHLFQPGCELDVIRLDNDSLLVQAERIQNQPWRAHVHRGAGGTAGFRHKRIYVKLSVSKYLVSS